MFRSLWGWFKSLFCKHDYTFYRNVYGDEIIWLGCRSLWKCRKCGKFQHRESLLQDSDNN